MTDTSGTAMTPAKHHYAFWSGVKEAGAEHLASLCGGAEPSTICEVTDLLAKAVECGNCEEIAKAIIAASRWVHGNDEIKYKQEKE